MEDTFSDLDCFEVHFQPVELLDSSGIQKDLQLLDRFPAVFVHFGVPELGTEPIVFEPALEMNFIEFMQGF